MSTSVAELPGAPPRCAHCSLPVPEFEVDRAREHQFCCPGCRTAYDVISAAGLVGYYTFGERRQTAVSSTARDYAEFDHPAFQTLYVRRAPDGLATTELYLDGVHCASCVWLVEKVPLAVPGAVSAELNVPRSLARLAWDPARTSLSAIARFLDRLGYPPHPFRGAAIDQRRQAEDRAMLVRIGIAGALAINVMTVALALYAGWFGTMEASYIRYFRWVSLALTVPSVLGPGRIFFRSAWAAIRARRLHMDIPIALALGAGFLRGAMNTWTDTGPIYFDGVVTLIFLLLAGRFLQQRAQRAAADSAELLHSLTPSTARLIADGAIREVPVEALVPNQMVLVRAGDPIPVDGVIHDGESTLDCSVLTGESRPVSVRAGDTVYAGTINQRASLTVRTVETGETSRLGRILQELEAGMQRRAPVVRTADRLAGWFIGVVLALAMVTWLVWQRVDPAAALDNAIALLIVTCPCALALATPLTMTVAIGRAARRGILIRGADALEVLSQPAELVLDKTGTITEGSLGLISWTGPAELQAAVVSLERHSSHPIARAFETAWADIDPVEAEQVQPVMGGCLTGVVGGRLITIGSPRYVLAVASDPQDLAGTLADHLTPVLVAVDGVVACAAGFGDPVRAGARDAVKALEARGWRASILSGDVPSVVQAAAVAVGIPADRARGSATPEDKLVAVERRLADGQTVVMVGDGVNDAPAIGRASVGIGVRGGAEACLAAADVFLARPGLDPLVELVDGARRTMRVIRRNIGISIGYNLIGAALAVTGLINPLLAAIMMPVSSLTVILISWRSRTFEATR